MLDFTDLSSQTKLNDPETAVGRLLDPAGGLMSALVADIGELVFHGLVAIPLAFAAGYMIADRRQVHLFDFHPEQGSWRWPEGGPGDEITSAGLPLNPLDAVGDVIVRVAISYPVTAQATRFVVKSPIAEIDLSLTTPQRSIVTSEAQVRAYGRGFRAMLDGIVARLPGTTRVHVFYAGPVSLAFHLGQQVSENIHPPVTVWNYSRGYDWGIDLDAVSRGETGVVRNDAEDEGTFRKRDEASNPLQPNHVAAIRSLDSSNPSLIEHRSSPTTGMFVADPESTSRFEARLAEAETEFNSRFPKEADPRIGFVQFASWPATFVESRFNLSDLRKAVLDAVVHRDNWLHPLWARVNETHAIQDGIESWTSLSGENRVQFWRIQSSGFVFHRQTMYDDTDPHGQFGTYEPGSILGAERLIAVVGLAVQSTAAVYQSLGIRNEPVTLRFGLLKTLERRLRVPATWTLIDSGLTAKIPEIRTQRTATVEEWIEKAEELANATIVDLMERFNAISPRYPERVLRAVLNIPAGE